MVSFQRDKFVLLISLVFIFTSDYKVDGVTSCEFYNQTQCGPDGTGCYSIEKCSPSEDGKRAHCYILLYREENGKFNIGSKGCLLNYEYCYDKVDCVDTTPKKHRRDNRFCCCDTDMCNQNFTWNPDPDDDIDMETPQPSSVVPIQHTAIHYVVTSVTVVILGVIIVVGVYRWRRKKELNNYPTTNGSLPLITTYYVFGEEGETNDERKHLL